MVRTTAYLSSNPQKKKRRCRVRFGTYCYLRDNDRYGEDREYEQHARDDERAGVLSEDAHDGPGPPERDAARLAHGARCRAPCA